jgi:4-diphosphocytidyl-2-C-methyl-D-erythritol kinase
MYVRRDQFARIANAPAKLNLHLEILGRRADGFHELETLMVPIRLSDSLSLRVLPPPGDGEAGAIDLEVRECFPARSAATPVVIPTGRENLAVRALELLRQRSGCAMGARLRLVKRVPAGAGLGGGSSDAAAALRLANSVWGLNWPTERLSEIAAAVGSDVPFFLKGGAACCYGRGERVEPVYGMRRYHLVLVKPPIELATAEVYRAYDSQEAPAGKRSCNLTQATRALKCRELFGVGRCLFNRLQAAAAAISPWVERLQRTFDSLDFLGHQLSGSGSAYFGICRHARHARRLAAFLRTQQLGLVYATRSYA